MSLLPPAKRSHNPDLSQHDELQPTIKARRLPVRSSTGARETKSTRPTREEKSLPKKKAKSRPQTNSEDFDRRKNKVNVTSDIDLLPKAQAKPAKRPVQGEEKENRSLHSFFGRANEQQRWARQSSDVFTVKSSSEPEDAIEDDDSLDEALVGLATETTEDAKKAFNRRKSLTRSSNSLLGGSSSTNNGPGLKSLQRTHKFVKPPLPTSSRSSVERSESRSSLNSVDAGAGRTWAERFAPTSLDELAVHKKKITDVKNLLAAVIRGGDRHVCEPSASCCPPFYTFAP